MTAQHRKTLINDTVVNVAQLLKEPVGSTRVVDFHLDEFPLAPDITSHDVEGEARLTRVVTGILADGRVRGQARLECVRCLELYDEEFSTEFDGEFRPSVDVRSGLPLPLPEDEEIFVIDNNHELDLGELLRQVVIIALPMQPICGDDCPGIPLPEGGDEEPEDNRLSVLERLLQEDQETH